MTDFQVLKIVPKLFINGIQYRIRKKTGSPGRIQAVSLEVTHRCIAKCIMCNIWRIPGNEPELSVNDWLKILSDDFLSDVRELDITGGEPFLLDDIDRLFSGISGLKNVNLKKLQSVAVTTNGFLTERVLDKTRAILKEFKKAGLDLVVVCAVDATGEIHGKIRNVKYAWEKANSTINGLLSLRDSYPNLIIGLKSTILPINIDELENISRYADERGLFTIISPRIVTGGRYLNLDMEKDLAFSNDDIKKMIRFFKGNRFKWSFHAESLTEYLESGRIKRPCSCGFNYFFIRSSGKVFPCPLIDRSIGNVKDKSIKDLFMSHNAKKILRTLGKYAECSRCTEPGLERYALPCEGFIYLGMLLNCKLKDFIALQSHLGLNKYM